jgi:eukaryotic-like serine/threonine-protein kinase
MVAEQLSAQTCLDVDAVLAWLDGAMSARRAADVEAHIDGCPVCRRVLSEAAIAPGDDAADPLPARLGPYEVRGVIGRGGMGEVYRAYDPRLDREVAIKMIRPYDRKRLRPADLDWFERETRAAAAISHPNVLAVFDVGHHRGVPYVVTELLAGESLRARLRRGAVPSRQAVTWARDLAHGMAAAHDRGIVHRDLKPDNVFVCGDSRVKILDFGVATFLRGPDDEFEERGLVVGTLGYMAPEQLSGEAVDHRTDIFAFGAVLFEMLAGKPAFAGPDEIAVAESTLSSDPLADIELDAPAPVVEIVRRCLHKKRDDRFQSARDLAFALDTLGTQVTRPVVVARRRWPFVAGLAVGALAAGGAVFAVVTTQTTPPPTTPPPPGPAVVTNLFDRTGQAFAARLAPDGTLYTSAVLDEPIGNGNFNGLRTYRRTASGFELAAPGSSLLVAMSRTGNLALLRDLEMEKFVMRGRLQVVDRDGHEIAIPGDVGDIASAAFLPDGSVAAIRNRGGMYQLESPIGNVVYRTNGQLIALAAARDGSLAFIDLSMVDVETSRRVVMRSPDGSTTFVGGDWQDATGVAWDGDDLVVSGGRGEVTKALWRFDRNGHGRVVWRAQRRVVILDVARDGGLIVVELDVRRRVVVGHAGTTSELRWPAAAQLLDLSLDGSRLSFSYLVFGEPAPHVFARSTLGGDPVEIGVGPGGILSHDGRHAVIRNMTPPFHVDDVELGPSGIVARRELPPGDIDSFQGASWLADGRVVFLATGANGPGIYAQALDGSPPKRLGAWTGGRGDPLMFRVSPDGKRASNRDINKTQLVDVKSSAVTSLGDAKDVVAGWSTSSDSLYVARFDGWPVTVTRRRLDGSKPIALFDIQPLGPDVVAVETVRVSGDGQTYVCSFVSVPTSLWRIDPEGPR